MNKVENNIKLYTKNRNESRAGKLYLSDEALQELIAATEAEPMLCPPKGFRNEVIDRARQKRKRMKNRSLFSYSMKVIVATAAALGLILIVPENIRPAKPPQTLVRVEQEDFSYQENLLYQFSNSLDNACSRFNGRLNELVGTEDHY